MNRLELETMDRSFGRLADTLLKNRELSERKSEREQERQRLSGQDAATAAYRKSEADARATRETETARHNKAMEGDNSEKIEAYIADPDNPNEGMGFKGTFDQLLAIKTQAEKMHGGKKMVVMSKPPSTVEKEVGSYTVNGMTHKFYTQKQADDYEAGLKAKGIDPEKAKSGEAEKERRKFIADLMLDKDMTPEAQARALKVYDAQSKLGQSSAPAESSDGQPAAPTSSKYDIKVVSPGEGGQAEPATTPVAAPSPAAPPVTAPLSGSPIASTPAPNPLLTGIPEIDNAVQAQQQGVAKRKQQESDATAKQQADEAVRSAAKIKKQKTDAFLSQTDSLQAEIKELVRQQTYLNAHASESDSGMEGIPSSAWGLTPTDRAQRILKAKTKLAALKAANPWSNSNADLSSQ